MHPHGFLTQLTQLQWIPIIIIITIITISFMKGIYTYTRIPETNNVPKEYNVAAILSLLFMVPISLVPALTLMYFYISTFTYFLNDFEMVSVALIITGSILLLLLLLLLF
jgi:hypothetical protein